jgi:hypothetical protein
MVIWLGDRAKRPSAPGLTARVTVAAMPTMLYMMNYVRRRYADRVEIAWRSYEDQNSLVKFLIFVAFDAGETVGTSQATLNHPGLVYSEQISDICSLSLKKLRILHSRAFMVTAGPSRSSGSAVGFGRFCHVPTAVQIGGGPRHSGRTDDAGHGARAQGAGRAWAAVSSGSGGGADRNAMSCPADSP